jgi:multiple sugar transport system permease protein
LATPIVGRAPRPPATFRERLDRQFWKLALAPTLIVLLALTVYPAVQLIVMGFSTVTFAEGQVNWQFSGLENFRTFLDDEIFPYAIRNTVLFSIVVVLFEMFFGFVLALLASQVKRFVGFLRAVLMIPILVPAIAIGTLWRLMYNYEFGIFNQILRALSLPPQSWTGNAALALPSIMVVDIWHWTSFVFLLMLAGIESLPIEPLEAARVDGASNWGLLRHVILPLLRPTIVVTLMFRTIASFKVFDEVFLLTGGGPGNATEVLSMYINRVFFAQSRMGYGALLSLLTILLVSVLVIFYSRSARQRSAS